MIAAVGCDNLHVRSVDDQPIGLPALSLVVDAHDLVDRKPVAGEDQYRLMLVDGAHNIIYSSVVTLFYPSFFDKSINISVFPNPTNSSITLSMVQDDKTGYFKTDNFNVKIVNAFGVVVKTATMQQPGWNANVSELKPGTYIVQVTNSSNKSLIGVTSFVKD